MPQTFTDEQIAELRRQLDEGKRTKQIADMVDAIYNDPALGIEARALIKKKFPDVPIPDYDIEQKVDAKLAAERREREEEAKKRKEAEEDAQWKSERKRTQEQYGFTDDSMNEVEKLMVEKKIQDYDVAASYFAAKNPKPSDDRGLEGNLWNHHRTDTFKQIANDPEGWAREELLRAAQADQQRQRQQY